MFGQRAVWGHALLCIIRNDPLNIILCADLIIALLTLNASYRAWRFPDEAIFLQKRFDVAELHASLLRSGTRRNLLLRDQSDAPCPQVIVSFCAEREMKTKPKGQLDGEVIHDLLIESNKGNKEEHADL